MVSQNTQSWSYKDSWSGQGKIGRVGTFAGPDVIGGLSSEGRFDITLCFIVICLLRADFARHLYVHWSQEN